MPLRVTQPFDAYGVGDEIDDAGAIAAIMASTQAHFVVPFVAPTEAPPDPAVPPAEGA